MACSKRHMLVGLIKCKEFSKSFLIQKNLNLNSSRNRNITITIPTA